MNNSTIALALPTNSTVAANLTTEQIVTGSIVSVVALITVIFNCIILTAFCKYPHLRTPFNIYILYLTISDLLCAVFSMTAVVANMVSTTWPFGSVYCSLSMYLDWMTTAAGLQALTIIGLDRLWALFAPFQYRHQHSVRKSAITCCIAFIYSNIVFLPYVIEDRRANQAEDASNFVCFTHIDKQPVYTMAVEIFLYVIPMVTLVLCYILINIKLRRILSSKKRIGVSTSRNVARETASDIKLVPLPRSATNPTALSDAQERSDQTNGSVRSRRNPGGVPGRLILNQENKQHRSLLVLAFFGITCWTPAIVYFLLGIDTTELVTYYNVSMVLQYSNCLVNPIIYHYSLYDIRDAIRKMMCCRRSR